jgi:Icc-related predicted phosphoesterase
MAETRKLLVTADLHFGLYPAGDACVLELAEFVRNSEADALVIAGDLADVDTDWFAACLDLFASFKGPKMVVPGNHDLWSAGVGTEQKYREVLPAIASDCGFRMLDASPVAAEGVGFIGNIGWYDYSFRNPELNIALEQYERKELPGVCTWNDGQFINWQMSDPEFTEKCMRKLEAAYRSIEPTVHTVVAVLHSLPFRELLYGPSSAAYEFCRAYMGSERIGRLLSEFRKVRYVFCGHRHGHATATIGHIQAFAVGSEYLVKRLIELDISTGEYEVHTFEPPASSDGKVKTDVLLPEEP